MNRIDSRYSCFVSADFRANIISHVRVSCMIMVMTVMLLPVTVYAEDHASFTLTAKRVITADARGVWSYEPGMVIVRQGKIVAVGDALKLQPPDDLRLIEFPDATIMPGLVCAAGKMIPSHTGDESVAGGYEAIDSFDPYGSYESSLAGGVTTVHLSPGLHRLLSGQGAVVKLGGPRDDMILLRQADLTVSFLQDATNPPLDVNYQTPSSSDVAIVPGVRQRPSSRMGMSLGLDEAIERMTEKGTGFHGMSLGQAWHAKTPLRIYAERAVDLKAASSYLKQHGRSGYLVGGREAGMVAELLGDNGVPVVYQLGSALRGLIDDIGFDPEAIDADLTALRRLSSTPITLAVSPGLPVGDLRVASGLAQRAGFSEQQVIQAITSRPAEVLGVQDRVGAIAVGRDADLVVLSGGALSTSSHVRRVYIGGELAYEAPQAKAIVVHADVVWVSPDEQFEHGAVLIEDGKISAVGKTVPHPPFAKVIEGGPGSYVTPGFIDARGHLGLDGDESAPGPEISLSRIIGVAGEPDLRVAASGVTSVMLSPYAASSQGSQVSLIKTAGQLRKHRTVRDTAGVFFDMVGQDPSKIVESLNKRLEAGKKYLEKWKKYEKELAEWKEKRAKGEAVNGKPASEETAETPSEADPITGTWSVTISGGPLPEPQTANLRLKLDGTDVEGRISVPGAPEELKVSGTFEDNHLSIEILLDIEEIGNPSIEADLVEEDHLVGKVLVEGMEIDFDATRTDKNDVQFKVVKRKTRGKDGRPLPPKVEASLEPLRQVLEKKIPIVTSVSTAAEIASVLKVAKDFELHVVLVGAEHAAVHTSKLIEKNVGVILPKQVVRWRNNQRYHQADDLSRQGVMIAFQSDGEDSAGSLPLVGLHAVERGMSADAALAAFTTNPAKMFHVQDRVGALQVGLDADLVIFSGHPFELRSRVIRVMINGEEVK